MASDNIQISAGDYHCGILKVWGSVYLWGRNNYGQIELPNSTAYSYSIGFKDAPCTQVSLGRYHTLVLRANGDVYGCGYNYNGELGRGFTSASPYYEQPFGLVTGLPKIRRIAAGAYHNMAIADNGYVWAWGSNNDGQLVRPAGPDEPTPFQITTTGGHWAALDIACGYNHTMVLRVTGQVYMAGANNYGQIGNNVDDNADVEVSTLVLSSAKSLPTSMYHGAGVINGDGSLLTWGYNSYRAIGNTSLLTEVLSPTGVEAKWPVEDLVDLQVGQYHSIGLKADGTIWTWGDNLDGNLGNGLSPTDSNQAVQAYNGSSVTDCYIMGSGSHAAHSMVGRADGTMYGFGNNVYGELDSSTLTDFVSPSSVGYHYPLSIGCGDVHTSYVNWSGAIYTTGRNNNGQLGSSYPTDRTGFSSISYPGTAAAKQVSVGIGHTLALMCDGRVLAWGANGNNQCGVSGNPVTTPQFVQRDTNGDGTPDGDLTNIVMVAAGSWHSFALESNGKIWAWGTNDAGRTGLGTSSGKTQYATRITGGASYYRSVAGGVYHGAAIDNTGTVYTWGYGVGGRLGNGLTSGNVLEPEEREDAAYDGLVTHVDCSYHTMILCADGDVFGTGPNGNGQLGDATFDDTAEFTIATPNWYPQVNISATASNAYESGTQATFQVSRSLTVPGTIEYSGIIDVNFDPNQGVAKTGIDLQNLTTTIRIPSASSAANFSVAAIDDQIDEDNESISIDVISGDRYQIGSTPTANGNVIDNDTANIILSLVSSPTSTESGGYATYTVRLGTEPTADVDITFQTSDTTEGTIWNSLTQKTYTFTSSNWSSIQYLYMVGENDDVVDGDIVYYLEHTATSGDPKYVAFGLLADQAVTNKDDDTAGFMVVPNTVETDEDGTTDTFTVTLTSEPVDDVTIPIASTNINEAEVSPTFFTFNAGNWNTGVEVTVTGANDDIDDGSVPYAIKLNPDNSTTDPNYQFLNPPDVSGTNHDNDTAGITIGPLDNDTEEDGTQGTFSVVLDTQPLSDVSIGLSSSDTGEVTLSSGSLTFTTANWNTPQVVTLTGVDDFIADGDQTVTIFTDPATGDAAYVGINPNDVTVDNLDDDSVGLTFNKTQLYVTEGGATDSYAINLDSEPIGGNVTVTITPQSGVETDKGELIFTSGNWATPQTVIVNATNDVIDEVSPEVGVQIDHSVSGADYGGINQAIDVDVTDNDTANIIYSQNPITVAEGGSGTSYNITLATEPTDQVNITVDANAQVLVNGGAQVVLAFTAANWNTPQAVNVTAIDDFNIESSPHAGDISYTVESTSDGFYDGLAAPAFTVNVNDNDSAGVIVSPTSIFITEAGASNQFTVTLTSIPTDDVVIPLSVSDSTEGNLGGVTDVTLNSGNWNTGVSVTVFPENDSVDDGNIPFTVVTGDPTSTSDTDYDGLNAGDVDDVTVTNIDNDTAGVTITESGGTTNVSEAGGTDTYDVVLTSEPTASVTVTVTAVNDVTVDETSLTFTTGNWNAPQTVTVSAIDDNDVESNPHAGVITHSASGGGYGAVIINSVNANVAENDAAGVTFGTPTGQATEAGGSITTTMVLDAKPTENVTINLTSADLTEVTVSPSSVVFTSFNWNTPQLITITGVDDDIIDGDVLYTITTSNMSSGDGNFNNVVVSDISGAAFDNTDDDVAGVVITESDGSTNVEEGGASDTYTIVLTAEPDSNVTINLSHDSEILNDVTDAVTFLPGTWDTPQTVTISANDDGVSESGHAPSVITHSITTGDGDFSALPAPASVTVNIADNDTPGLLIVESSGSTDVVEDVPVLNGDTVSIRLLALPSGNVTVNIADTDSQLTFSPSSLSFTTGDWSTPQTLYITGTGDGSVDPGSADLDFTCTGGGYAAVAETLSVNVTDSDTPGITITEISTASLNEDNGNTVDGIGTTGTYEVVLDSPPGAAIAVSITDDGQLTVSPSTLNFDNADWFTPQLVTITVVDDDVDETSSHNSTITHTPPGGYNSGTAENLVVSIADNDTRGVTITESAASTDVSEATPATYDLYTIVLDSEPTATVTITVTGDQVNVDSDDAPDGVASTQNLTFTTANWDTVQTVRVYADDDNVDESLTHAGNISHTIAGGDYNAFVVSDISVNVTDDDTAAVVLDAGSVTDVDESGTTSTFDLSLATEPTATVSITVYSSDTGEINVSPSVLVFNAGNYSTPQEVTLTGVDDDIVDGDITVTVGYTAPSSSDAAYAALSGSNTNLDNTDDDSIGFVITETDGDTVVQEEGETSDTFSIALSSEPIGGGGVTVQVSHGDSQVDVEGGTSTNLNFTAANWNVPQIVTIEANDDAAAEVNPHTAVIDIDATGDDYNGESTTLNVDVQDNDQAAITVTPSSGLNVTEAGSTTTFDVVLDTAPSADVTVDVVSSDTGEATVDLATLTFTTGDWNTPQTVTVTGVDDNIDDGNITFDIDLTANSGDLIYDGATATAEVTCTDNDTAGMTVTPLLGLTTTENANVAVFFVYLNTQPTGDVVMDVTSNDTGEGQVSPATLTFTNSNWQSPQIVTVTGQDDNIDDGDVAYAVDVDINVGSTVDANYDLVASKNVQLTNIDNDSAGVELFEADGSTDVVEGGATDIYRVRLDTQPTASVTISLSTEKGEVSLSPSTLTFTTANWNVYQDVTVTAVDDDVEELIAPHSDNIIHTAGGGGYDGVSIDDLNVSITDDDSAGLLVSPTSGLSVPEDASSDDTFTVKLLSEPTALVIVNITVDDDTEATVTPSLITFSPSASPGNDGHWDFNQTITVTGVDDDVVDGSVGFTISVDTVSGDALYNSLNQDLTGQTTDDDTFGITVSPTSLTVAETGTSATYSVVLESEPISDVTINVTTPDSAEISLDTSVLIFNNVNWDAPQFVKVTGVDDPIDDGTQAAVAVNNVASSGDGNYNGIDPDDVDVDNDDDDDAAVIIAVSGGLTSVSEAGLTDTYEVSLATQPTADIDIDISGDGQIEPDVSVLTFTAANWSTPQTVTVSAVNDNIAEGSHSGTITHSSSDAEYNGVSINSVTASVDDDDVVDIEVSPIDGLETIEDGTQATFTVVLSSEPLVNVVIGVSSDNTAEGTVSPATLTFTPSDWDTPQTVTITGVDELVDDGDQPYTIVLSNASAVGDANYNNFDVSDVSVTNIDDDGAGVTLSKTTLSLSEAGTSDNYTVVLDTQPTDDVIITLSADLDNVNLSQTSLTFTNANYDTPQQITVSADNDDIAEGFHQITISHTAAGDVYTGISISNVAANITDNDTAGISVSPTSGLTTNEAGATDTFDVVLDSEPTSSVTISVTSQDTTEATVAPGSLTFTPANWDTPQTVTVTGADDALADGNINYTIALGTAVSDDTFYGGVIDPTDVTGTNTDDEVAGITVTPTSGLTTTESGGSAVFTVRLNTEPTDDVVISLASDTAGEGTASPATLTFTTSNWDTNQTVTVTGVDDDVDDDDQNYTIVLNTPTSSDNLYNVIDPADVSVSNISTMTMLVLLLHQPVAW